MQHIKPAVGKCSRVCPHVLLGGACHEPVPGELLVLRIELGREESDAHAIALRKLRVRVARCLICIQGDNRPVAQQTTLLGTQLSWRNAPLQPVTDDMLRLHVQYAVASACIS